MHLVEYSRLLSPHLTGHSGQRIAALPSYEAIVKVRWVCTPQGHRRYISGHTSLASCRINNYMDVNMDRKAPASPLGLNVLFNQIGFVVPGATLPNSLALSVVQERPCVRCS